ncbi:MAG: ABC transporter permease [Bacillota bacterium]
MIRFRIIKAIIIKELQDIRTNSNLLVMLVMPIFFTFVWDNLMSELPKGFGAAFGLIFLVVMVGMYIPSMLIAEEKEKKTIEVLMLSPARPAEVFVGKGMLTFIAIIGISVIITFMAGVSPATQATVIFATGLTSLFAIFIGMIVGLIANNQMSTGVVGLPVYLLLLLVPQLAGMGPKFIDVLARFLPTYYYLRILELSLIESLPIIDLLPQIAIILFSTIITFLFLIFTYTKKGLSN